MLNDLDGHVITEDVWQHICDIADSFSTLNFFTCDNYGFVSSMFDEWKFEIAA
jgi:hypothetical protein